ncbi:2-hydroxyacid dehydrogenase [Phenylobacterium montanum]|uniref:2-hydroxyacid dehydrogenase n=1 Tax=Phenylobacterium montanum TaxID=2823693 RepID=A0A975G330_9CAUL|nr:2-hydroxyacid dehydrogenase [Caulobacter sp. S6]QUD90238.1 2-hydroxyacid dehydrogenase [Caulobacter sp. S6]
MESKPVLLQLCPFAADLEQRLTRRFEVHRWFEETDPAGWLARYGSTVRAVATGGHMGISNDLMAALPALGIVAINGVGFDKVDLDTARARGVRVTTTPDVLTDDVADLAVGLIIAQFRAIPAGDAHVRQGAWPAGDRPLGRKVTGARFGIFGLGRIGLAIARRLAPFGAIAYMDQVEKPEPYRFVPSLVDLARESDVLILASAANASTFNIVDAEVIEALGPDGVLVNVARGSLVDEEALIAALTNGTIAGAALDVFAREPDVPERLRGCDRVVMTPHIASGTRETRRNMANIVVGNVEAFLDGGQLTGALV